MTDQNDNSNNDKTNPASEAVDRYVTKKPGHDNGSSSSRSDVIDREVNRIAGRIIEDPSQVSNLAKHLDYQMARAIGSMHNSSNTPTTEEHQALHATRREVESLLEKHQAGKITDAQLQEELGELFPANSHAEAQAMANYDITSEQFHEAVETGLDVDLIGGLSQETGMSFSEAQEVLINSGGNYGEAGDLNVPSNPNAEGYNPTSAEDSSNELENNAGASASAGEPLFDENGNPYFPAVEDDNSIFSDWDMGDSQAAYQLGMSVLSLYNALDGGSDLAMASAGINTLVSVDRMLDNIDGVDGIFGDQFGDMLGGITAAIGIFSALDNGDGLGALAGGFQVAGLFMDNFATVFDGVLPGIGLALNMLSGDVMDNPMGAMTSMVAMIPGWGWAAAAVLSIFGGSLMGDPPDPRAFMDFVRNAEGEIDFETSSNETGGGLEAMLDGSGSAFVQYLEALEDGYARVLPTGQIEVDALPRLDLHQEYGHDEVEWRMAA